LTQTSPAISTKGRIDAFFGLSLHIIGVVFLARFIMDIGNRMMFPFIPQFSLGLGLTIAGFGWLLFIHGLVGLVGPIFGIWSDRYGRRQTMAIGMGLQAVGLAGLALTWQWWATMPLILTGLGVAAFLPAQQAYISDQVPYQKRGRAIASVEFAWSMSAIVALPIIGWMIDAFGWRLPLLVVGLISLGGALLVWWQLPPTTGRHVQASPSWVATKNVFLTGNVMAAVSVALLVFVAASIFITVWGIWLSEEFKFDATTLGWVGTAVGVAELAGAGLSSLFIDRIGKKRGSEWAILLLVVTFLLLPLTQNTAAIVAIATLVILGIVFEFTIVSLIPLFSEQVPAARGTVLSLTYLGIGIGSAIAPPITTTLWERFGLGAVCAAAAACLLLAFGLTWKFLHEH